MNKITKRSEAKRAVGRCIGNADRRIRDSVQEAAHQLGENPSPDEVHAFMRKFWPNAKPLEDPQCDECREHFPSLVRFGADPHEYDNDTIDICERCLRKAVALLEVHDAE